MAKEVYRVEIPIEAKDEYSAEIKKAGKEVKKLEKTVEGASKGIEKFGGSTRKAEGDVSKFQSGMRGTLKIMKEAAGRTWNLTINAVDKASRVISGINSFVHRVAGRSYRFTIRAVDMASRAVRGIFRAITSIPAMITIGLSIVGVGKLKEATVGAAMSFEGYETSMTHWLDGNTKKAKELVGWMGKFADTTPFSSVDLFPALAQGVGISGGNVPEAQRMLKIAADMAALTPGRSVEDAMDALGGAQMGNFEMMKGFGMRILKEDYENMGGWEGFLNESATRFEDGAVKLSKTSEGILATLRGYRSTIFRSLGEGILEPMKPRLDSINKWLENNQDTWGRWKDTVKGAGQQASEWAFSKLETGFSHIKTNYLENDEFKSLSFEGKIAFVMDDINGWWESKGKPAVSAWWEGTGQPWAAKMGLSIGEAIFEGIKTGITTGLGTLGELWSNVGDTAKDKGVLSKETATATGGAALVTGVVGSMVLSPVLKVAEKVWNVGKWGVNKLTGRDNKTPSDGKTPNTPKTRSERHQKTPKKSKLPKLPKFLKLPKFKMPELPKLPSLSKLPKLPKIPKIPKGLLRNVPFLGTLLGGAALATSTKEERPGTVGAIAGGLAGAKGGAMAGAGIGSIVPGVGTAIGAGVGTIAGGIGGAIGGEKLMSWLFGPKKAVAQETPSGSVPSSDGNLSVDTGLLASSTAAMAEKMQVAQGNVETLTMHLGEASGHVVGAFSPLAEGTATLQHNISTLTTYLGEASGQVVGAFYPMSEQGPLLAQNMNALGINLAEASVFAVEAFYPISERGPVIHQNMDALGINLAESSSHVVGAFYPLSERAPVLHQNMSALSTNLGEASVWVSALYGIQDGAASVKAALGNLASRISSVPTPSVSASAGPRPAAYADGGYINRPHLGLVGEAGPEMIIPLSSGKRARAMDLHQQAGQMLGASPSNGRGNNVVDFYGRTGIKPGGKNTEPLVKVTSSGSVAEGSGDVTMHQQIDVNPSINITIQADSNGSIDASHISNTIVDELGVKLAEKIMEAKGNMFITAR